jgi:hypothetical protein
MTVNHFVNFVDPVIGAHTQNIENMWMCAKRKKKKQMGQHKNRLAIPLTEFMWQRKFGDRPTENLIRCLQVVYPTL